MAQSPFDITQVGFDNDPAVICVVLDITVGNRDWEDRLEDPCEILRDLHLIIQGVDT